MAAVDERERVLTNLFEESKRALKDNIQIQKNCSQVFMN